MTKEFIKSQIHKAKSNARYHEQEVTHLTLSLHSSKGLKAQHKARSIEFRELAAYLSQHPVMQEGEVYGDGGYEHPAPSLLPVDDEQPELHPCPECSNPIPGNYCGLCETSTETGCETSYNITDYTTGCADVPSGLELPPNFTDITSNFIEHARDAEMKLISELFKTTTGEELTEQNAHRVCIDYGINRSISIDGVIIGQFKQDMLPTDNGYKCSITFVPDSPRSYPPNDPGAHSMNIV